MLSVVGFLAATGFALRNSRDRGDRAWALVDSTAVARLLTAAALAWTLFAGVRYGTFAAGGSDSYGYVSQAHLFARGGLADVIPMRPEFTWRDAELSLIPLGYRPAAARGRMSPIYPPGLPLVMAALLPFGERAMYLTLTLFGAAVILCTASAGRRLGDPLAGGVAALFVSVSATFLLMHFSPMSDVPVTALWLGALLCAASHRSPAPFTAGFLTAAAIVMRPNLAPLSLVVGATIVVHSRSRARSVASFTAPIALAVGFLMWIQWQRYGHPLSSGYGSTGELFSLAYIAPNLATYASRLTGVYTPWIWLCVLSPLLLWRRAPRAFLLATVAFVAGTWLAYLPYTPFEPWFFTRFLLPAIPGMLLLATLVAFVAIRHLPVWLRPVVVAVVGLVMMTTLAKKSRDLGVYEAAVTEQKYPRAGQYVREQLPPGAYVLARQHSGSVRLYGERPTIRWDVVGGDQLDLVVTTLRAIGAPVYLVADDDEIPQFASHFQGQAAAGRLSMLAQFGQARVYVVE